MDRSIPRRPTRPQRPPLNDYIRGRAKLEDLVSEDKITRRDRNDTKKRTLLATVNSINRPLPPAPSLDKSRLKKVDKMKSSKHCHSEPLKIPLSSLRSERSAQGDMAGGSNARTFSSASTKTSVIVDRLLNDKEKEISALKQELDNLRQFSSKNTQSAVINDELNTFSLLQKLVNDLVLSDPTVVEPSNSCEILIERLRTGVQALREYQETSKLKDAERETKLTQFRLANELLQKHVENLKSSLQKITEESELRYNQLKNVQTQNNKLRADLEATHQNGMEMCTKLMQFIQDKFRNDMHRLHDFDKNLQDRVKQLKQAVDKLEKICRRHIRLLEKSPPDQIERLKGELQESEIANMRQVCEVTALYREQEKQIDELQRTNQELLENVRHYETVLLTLNSENRSLRNHNQYLQENNKALQEVCQKKIDSLTSPQKRKTLATLNQKTLDAEMAYSQELVKHADDTIKHIIHGSTVH